MLSFGAEGDVARRIGGRRLGRQMTMRLDVVVAQILEYGNGKDVLTMCSSV
jgi:hypothetical protein